MLTPIHTAKGALASIDNLCKALDLTRGEIDAALALDDGDKYSELNRPKADGSIRTVYRPHPLIRKVQRRLNKRIFSDPNSVAWPSFIYGSIPNQIDSGHIIEKDYIACARVHCGAKSLLKMDIESFFDNIHESIVLGIFSNFLKCSDDVSLALTRICTRHSNVVQGGLTSSYLANLCLYDVEKSAVERLQRKGLRYTRLVDDITVSSTVSNYNFSYAQQIISGFLLEKGLPINNKKTKVLYVSSTPLLVHGLRVNFKEPRLPADEVARIRASVRNIELLSSESNYRTSHSYRHDFNRCMGRVNKLKRIGHQQHAGLIVRLGAINPLPSKKDITRCLNMLNRIRREHSTKHHTYGYAKRFHVLHERLNVLARSFPAVAASIRMDLKSLVPTYD